MLFINVDELSAPSRPQFLSRLFWRVAISCLSLSLHINLDSHCFHFLANLENFVLVNFVHEILDCLFSSLALFFQ